ncbi:hypothetical protein TRVL_08387 [Trypanosoma vivax]|nr:hypothetical protein TRVL_08387 [Trypanosoma vivax]
MDGSDIYCDDQSVTSLSQFQGRPAMRLDYMPLTPTLLTPHDTNTNSAVWQKEQKHQTSWTTASSPASSPSRSTHQRRVLTPPASVNSLSAMATAPLAHNWRRAPPNESDAGPDSAPMSRGGDLSSRYVSFSFTSGLTSQRQSENRTSPLERASSFSPSPAPRRSILPAQFPDLQFSDCENTLEQETQTQGSARGTHHLEYQASKEEDSVRLIARWEENKENIWGKPKEQCHGSGLLTENTPLDAVKLCDLAEEPGAPSLVEDTADNYLKERVNFEKHGCTIAGPPSPKKSSILLCSDGVDATNVAVTGGCGMERSAVDESWDGSSHASGVKRQRGDVDTIYQPEDGSLVLAGGRTPTPYRKSNAADAARAGVGASVVLSVCESDSVTPFLPVHGALFECNSDAKDLGHGRQSDLSANTFGSSERSVHDGLTLSKRSDARGEAETAITTARKTVMTVSPLKDCGSASGKRDCLRPCSPSSLSEELRDLIRDTRERLNRTSERLSSLVKTSHDSNCDSSDRRTAAATREGDKVDKDMCSEGNCAVARSLQLSMARSFSIMGDGESAPEQENVVAGVSKPFPTDTAALCHQLASHADMIHRRLRGYDSMDVGTLPLVTVARVVRHVLSMGATPSSHSGDAMDLSWCIATPSSVKEQRLSLSPLSNTALKHKCESPGASGDRDKTWGRAVDHQKALAVEDDAMRVYTSIWHCFCECFGELHAGRRFGVLFTSEGGGAANTATTPTLFPRLRQQLSRLRGHGDGQCPPLDIPIDYRVFVSSLAELDKAGKGGV